MKFIPALSLIVFFVSVPARGDDALVETFQSVVPASQVINHSVISSDGVEMGTVSDIVIDRNFGCVALIAVRSNQSPALVGSSYFVPPESVSYSVEKDRLTCAASSKEMKHFGDLTKSGPMALIKTSAMAKLYEGYQATPYWKAADETDSRLSLITVDELDGRIVRDSDWQVVARVQEILLEPQGNWRVAYLSLGAIAGADRKQRLAVPMAAFALKQLSPTWLLDVSSSAELLKKTFPRGEWPTEVDRGWTEFVHVKYGASLDGGLQQLPTLQK